MIQESPPETEAIFLYVNRSSVDNKNANNI